MNPADDGKNKQTPLERCIAGVCLDLIANARIRRKKFMRTGHEIMQSGYSREVTAAFANLSRTSWFKATMPKTAIAFRVIIPSLTGPVPNRMLRPVEGSTPEMVARTAARSAYLNYTPGHTNYIKNRRLSSQEMLGYGMGIMWTGKDERTGLITTSFDTVRRLYLDPAASTLDDVHVVMRERLLPRFDIVQAHPKQLKLIMDLPTASKLWLDEESNYAWEGKDKAKNECVRIFELYFDRGIQHFPGGRKIIQEYGKNAGQPMSDEQAKIAEFKADEKPLKYTISEDGKLIDVQEWEIPFHAMPLSPWPFTPLYSYQSTDSPYPISMLEPGLPYQEIMNHMVTQMMDKMRFCMKTLIAVKKQGRTGLSPENMRRTLKGGNIEMMEVDFPADATGKGSLKDNIEQWDWPMDWLNPWMAAYNNFDAQFEQATGLNQFLITGQGSTQDRSAAASTIRDRNTRVNIEDMRDQNADFETIIAKKEAFAAAYLNDKDEVKKVIPLQAANWGELGTEEEKDPMYWVNFANQHGLTDPAQVAQFAAQKVGQIFTIDEIVYGTEFSIEAGSTRRKDIDQQLELFKEYKNTIAPVQMQSMDFDERAIAYDTLAADAKLQGLDQSLVASYQAMAAKFREIAKLPPPPMAPPAKTA